MGGPKLGWLKMLKKSVAAQISLQICDPEWHSSEHIRTRCAISSRLKLTEWEGVQSGNHVHRRRAASEYDRISPPVPKDRLQNSTARSRNVIRNCARERVSDVIVGRTTLLRQKRVVHRQRYLSAGSTPILRRKGRRNGCGTLPAPPPTVSRLALTPSTRK